MPEKMITLEVYRYSPPEKGGAAGSRLTCARESPTSSTCQPPWRIISPFVWRAPEVSLRWLNSARSWKRIETMSLDELQERRAALWLALEGVPYNFTPPSDEGVDDDVPAAVEGKENPDAVPAGAEVST